MNSSEPIALLRLLAGAMTAALGDLFDGKNVMTAATLFARQVEALIELDPAYAEALRELVHARVRPLCPDDESIEKVLTDTLDPNHVYWLAIAPRMLLRSLAMQRVNPAASPLGESLGRMFGFPGGGTMIPLEPEED